MVMRKLLLPSTWLALFVLLCVVLQTACASRGSPASGGPASGLLSGKPPSQVKDVQRAGRLTDGIVSVEGGDWRTNLTSTFGSPRAFAVWDLGEPKSIGAVFLQADNDDVYTVSVSSDGQTYRKLFDGAPVRTGAGMRPRFAKDLHDAARFVRLSASGGDGRYAVSELCVFETAPSVFPPAFEARAGTDVFDALHPKVWIAAIVMGLFLLVTWRKAPRWTRLGVVLPIAVVSYLVYELYPLAPIQLLEQSLLRCAIAAVASWALIREALAPPRFRIDARVVLGVLGLCSIGAVACYYNLFVPQFRDQKKDERMFVHPFDMRVYFPVAKYFKELGFDGVYFASVAACLDDGESPATLADVDIRDLRDHRMRKVGEVTGEIQAVKARFSSERWESFRTDMRWFRQSMGRHDYLWSLTDHGGNATPVWLLVAKVLFSHASANGATLLATGLLDPLLLVILFAVVWRTFGLRTMLVSIVLFGATDFYMFGSNWAGATLRQDWMVAVGLGACALKKERWTLGGALLAYGALIRAFPAMALVGLAAPLAVHIYEHWRKNKTLPAWEDLRKEARPLALAAAGAAATIVLLVGASALSFPAGTWGAWLHKVQLLSKDAHLNHVSWRTIIMYDPGTTLGELAHAKSNIGWQEWQFRNYADRRIIYYLGIAAFTAMLLLACRKKRLDQAALAGLALVPVVFYPANYYCHFIFLLAIWASQAYEDEKGVGLGAIWGWLCLLGMCVAQFATLQQGNTDLCFVGQSAILIVGLVLMLAPEAREGYRALFEKDKPAAKAPADNPAAAG